MTLEDHRRYGEPREKRYSRPSLRRSKAAFAPRARVRESGDTLKSAAGWTALQFVPCGAHPSKGVGIGTDMEPVHEAGYWLGLMLHRQQAVGCETIQQTYFEMDRGTGFDTPSKTREKQHSFAGPAVLHSQSALVGAESRN
jgi:hypothetical protein